MAELCRITQTLLYKYLHAFDESESSDRYDEFIKALNREKTPPTHAMLEGNRFEGLVNATLDGVPLPDDHEWAPVIPQLTDILQGSQQQVTVFRPFEVDGDRYLLHGVLDFLKAGTIYDTKYSKNYYLNKYFSSPQHPMYLELVPKATEFQYLACDGKFLYKEIYHRGDGIDLAETIRNFRAHLRKYNLEQTYIDLWKVSNERTIEDMAWKIDYKRDSRPKPRTGRQRCVILGANEGISSTGKNMITIDLRVSESEVLVRYYLVEGDSFNRKATAFFDAFPDITEDNWSYLEWVGCEGAADFKTDDRGYLAVKFFLTPDEAKDLPPFVGQKPPRQKVQTLEEMSDADTKEDDDAFPF